MALVDDDAAVARFQAYLRMKTVHPDPTPGYRAAIEYFAAAASAAGFEFSVAELCAGHPLGVITWRGSAPELDSLVLNTHMDVVPVEVEKWTKVRGGRGSCGVGSASLAAVTQCAARCCDALCGGVSPRHPCAGSVGG